MTPNNPVFRQELIGPVAMVFRVKSEEEAILVANDTEVGSFVYAADLGQAKRVADRIDAGMVFINCVGAEGAELLSVEPSAQASAASWDV